MLLSSPSLDSVVRHHLRHFLQLRRHLRCNQTLLHPVLGETLESLVPGALQDSVLARDLGHFEHLVLLTKPVHQMGSLCTRSSEATSPPRRLAHTAVSLTLPLHCELDGSERQGLLQAAGRHAARDAIYYMGSAASISTQAKT